MTTRKTCRWPNAWALCGALAIAAMLSACGNEDKEQESSPDRGQTIARVNAQEITEHELEAELERLGRIDPEQRSAMAREVLRRMVQRAVLAQKAEENGLHRTPEVMMELRRKRAETLAKAYLENGLARQLPISKYDVEDFIDRHPHYFEKRKHYVFDQLLIESDLMTDEVRNVIEELGTLEEVETALSEMNVAFSRRLNANLGSQFRREAVVKLDALEPGEIFLTETKDHVVVSKLVGARLQPVSGEEARDIARHLLTAQRDAGASKRMIEELLANANIEFLGSFADMQIFASDGEAEPSEEISAGEEEAAQNNGGEPQEGRRKRVRKENAQ